MILLRVPRNPSDRIRPVLRTSMILSSSEEAFSLVTRHTQTLDELDGLDGNDGKDGHRLRQSAVALLSLRHKHLTPITDLHALLGHDSIVQMKLDGVGNGATEQPNPP